jgi:hypothetical protein
MAAEAAGITGDVWHADRIVIGRWEWVQFPGFSLQPQRARVDTGARRSCVHAAQLERHGDEVAFVLAC